MIEQKEEEEEENNNYFIFKNIISFKLIHLKDIILLKSTTLIINQFSK